MNLSADFGLAADDYARHRAGFPDSLFERLASAGIGCEGQCIIDLGTGTGSLARGFAHRNCYVVGIDPSAALLEQARLLDARAGVKVDYRSGVAEATGLEDQCADVVSAGQCWHWFDRPRAVREVSRVLRSGGVLVIAHFDWIPLPGNLVEATERLIEAHNPAWNLGGSTGVHPQWLTDLAGGGLQQIESFSYDEPVHYTPEGWRGRVRASAGVGASLPQEQVSRFDAALGELLARDYPGPRLEIPHRVFYITGRKGQ